MSKHDDRRITLDDVFMNQESLEQMIRDREAEREAERLRKRSKKENEKE